MTINRSNTNHTDVIDIFESMVLTGVNFDIRKRAFILVFSCEIVGELG